MRMANISGLVAQFPYIAVFLLLIFGGIGFPFPEDTTLILSGFLISTEVVKPVPILLVVYSGVLLADFGLYFFGRKYGRRIVTHKRFHKIITMERLSRLEEKFKRKGGLIILIGRHVIGLRAQIFLAAGVLRMPAPKFLVMDAVASIFTMAVLVGIGYIGGNSLRVVIRDITRIEHMAILLGILLLVIFMLYRYFKSRRNGTRP